LGIVGRALRGAQMHGDVQRNAARGMAGSVQDARLVTTPAYGVAFLELGIDCDQRRGRYAKPVRLHLHLLVEGKIVWMHEYGRAGGFVETGQAAYMVDMGVSAENGADFELAA